MVRVGDIEDQSLLEDGKYAFRIKKAELKQGPKAKYIALEMAIIQGEASGRSLFDRITLGPKSLFRIKPFLVALGFEDTELESVSIDPQTKTIRVDEDALGREILQLIRGGAGCADVVTEGETVNKETGEKYPPRNKVRAYLPLESTPSQVAWPE